MENGEFLDLSQSSAKWEKFVTFEEFSIHFGFQSRTETNLTDNFPIWSLVQFGSGMSNLTYTYKINDGLNFELVDMICENE